MLMMDGTANEDTRCPTGAVVIRMNFSFLRSAVIHLFSLQRDAKLTVRELFRCLIVFAHDTLKTKPYPSEVVYGTTKLDDIPAKARLFTR